MTPFGQSLRQEFLWLHRVTFEPKAGQPYPPSEVTPALWTYLHSLCLALSEAQATGKASRFTQSE